jgi:hypothetical protein
MDRMKSNEWELYFRNTKNAKAVYLKGEGTLKYKNTNSIINNKKFVRSSNELNYTDNLIFLFKFIE